MPKLRPSPCPNPERPPSGQPAAAPGIGARRQGWPPALCSAVGVACTGLAQASDTTAAQSAGTPAGLWWFALAALLGLAAAGYTLGRMSERRRLAAALFETRSQHQALLASLHDTVWRTDAQHRFVSLHAAGPHPTPHHTMHAVPVPPWSAHAAWAGLMQAQRSFANVALQTETGPAVVAPADAAAPAQATAPGADPAPQQPTAWLLSGQPVLGADGRFAGFVGTARAAAAAQSTAAGTGAGLTGPATGGAAAAGQAPAARSDAGAANAGLSGALPGADAAANAEKDARTETKTGAAALAAALAESDEAYNFSYTVVHDLRAPIRVVDGFTRIVKEDYGPVLDRVANDHLERVLNAAARMNKMIDALLTLARLSNQPLTRQPVNLSQIARYVVDELQSAQPAREVDVHIEEGLLVTGDPTLLRVVLENLLGNAWKYSSRTAQAQISLTSTRHGAGRAFVVRDNGVGFDMRAADRLFGVFQRLHSPSEFPGHGVGLTSTRRIVRRHGGDIWAESEPARGAAFSFTLAEG